MRIYRYIDPFPKGDMAMDLDLETFLVALYVIVDSVCQSHTTLCMSAGGGPPALGSVHYAHGKGQRHTPVRTAHATQNVPMVCGPI